jgi:hypothetical protein
MSDTGVSADVGSVNVDTPAPAVPTSPNAATSAATEVPQEPSSPASDPRPAETPVITEPPAQTPKPAETPVIPTPQETPASAQATAATVVSIKDRAYAALEKIRFNKRKKLDKIIAFSQKKRSIKNDDVEKLLKVSDSTAQRYLNQLIVEGKLRRVGVPERATYEPL